MRDTARRPSQYSPGRETRILDIGCANGGLLRELKALGYSHICGVDPSPTCVENTRAFGIEAHVASLSDSFQLGVFDRVVLTGVLEHVQDLHQAMTQIRSTVGTNGMCFAEVPDASRYEQFLFSPFQDFNTEHINHFSHQSLLNLFSTFGFSEESWGQVEILSSGEFEVPVRYDRLRKTALFKPCECLFRDGVRQCVSALIQEGNFLACPSIMTTKTIFNTWEASARKLASLLLSKIPRRKQT